MTILLLAEVVDLGVVTRHAIRSNSLSASEKLLFRHSCPEIPVSFVTKSQD